MRKYEVNATELCSERSVVHHLRAVAALGIACTYLMSGSVSAQNANNPSTADGPVYVIAKVQGEKTKISNDIDQASAKRDALIAKQTQAEKERDEIDHKARLFNDSSKTQQLLKDEASYRVTCGEGRIVYGADIARCNNAAANINQRDMEHNRIFMDLTARYNAKNALVQQIQKDRVFADAELTKLQKYLSWLNDLYARLTKGCTDMPANATIEELKNRCGNVQFNFAKEHLPECETERCKALVIYAKPLIDSHLPQTSAPTLDLAKVQTEIQGVQEALKHLNQSINLDADERKTWEKSSADALRDSYALGAKIVLDALTPNVKDQIAAGDKELKRAGDLLYGEADPSRRVQLHTAFGVLHDRKEELMRLKDLVDSARDTVDHLDEAKDEAYGKRQEKSQSLIEAVWEGCDKLKLLPKGAPEAKAIVDASYDITVQTFSVQRINALNGNSESYLKAVAVLSERMKTLVKLKKAAQGQAAE